MGDFDGYRALSFDCYGTLIDWETGIADALRPWAERHEGAATEDLVALFGAIETVVEQERPTDPYPDILAEVHRRIGDELAAPVSPEEARRFGASVGEWPAFPDSGPALARLSERYELIVLSNVDRASFSRSNERLGVEFDLVITAEDVGSYKPDPANFEALLDAVGGRGMEARELLHVAESLYHDHEPATAAGIDSVWIHRRHDRVGHGATHPPGSAVEPKWRFTAMEAFADTALS